MYKTVYGTVRYGTVVNQRQRRESETRSSFTWFPAGCACTENSARIALRQNYRCSVLDDLGGARSAKRSSFPAGCAPKHSSGRAPRAELPQRRRKSRRQECYRGKVSWRSGSRGKCITLTTLKAAAESAENCILVPPRAPGENAA